MLLTDRRVAFRSVAAPRPRESRGSGLVIALGVLAMLAIMATTFITLMRLNARLSRAFNDDLQVEMLCQGVANYVVGVLRESQDRSMMQNADGSLGVKYANRVGIMGGRGWWQGMGGYDPSGTTYITDFGLNIPGRNTDYWAAARFGTNTRRVNKSTPDGPMGDHAYGTGPAHDVWYSSSTDGYWDSGLYSNSSWYEYNQASFGGSSMDIVIVNRQDRVIANALNPAPLGTGKESYFAMVYGHMNGISDLSATQCPYALYNYSDTVNSWPIWEPAEPCYGYGPTTDNPTPHWYRTDACNNEMYFLGNYCYDSMTFLTHGLTSHIHPGAKLTQAWEGPGLNNTSGMMRLPGGLFWRWSVKIGVPEERYVNLNMIGNSELQVGSGRLANMDKRGLQACNGDTTCRTNHLGMISWRGYPGDATSGQFVNRYDAVSFSPYQIDPYRLLGMDVCDFTANVETNGDKLLDPAIFPVANICDDWIAQRWGNGRIPADPGSGGIYASDQFRPGWRRDGASYYKIPSPDNPQGNDWYYGASEALNHQDEDIVPQSSRVFSVLYNRLGNDLGKSRFAFDRMRAYVSTFGADTILRGKLWPQEGPPYTGNQGNFRDMRVLRKVNLNMLGARAYPSWAPAGDVLVGRNGSTQNYSDNPTKGGAACTNWCNRAAAERDRLYYMIKAMLTFTGTTWNPPGVVNQYGFTPNWLACQFVASLTDMVSWDQCETLYAAPDGSGAWALGMKKFPVINEVAFYSNTNANTANYNLFRLSVELYNPAENIPWVADADEAFDISQYVLQVGNHYFRVGTLHKFNNTTWTDMGLIDQAPNNMIGADGLYGVPVPGWYLGGAVAPDPSWSRFVHLTWYDLSQPTPQFPPGVTYDELQGGPSSAPQGFTGVTIALWKPLPPGFPLAPTIPDTNFIKTDLIGAGSGRYMLVDTTDDPATGKIKLIRPWYPGAAPGRNENGPADIKADPDFSPALTRNKTNYSAVYHRWDPMNANVYVDPSSNKTKYGKGDKGTVQWCPGWTLARASTIGRPNTEYWPNMYSTDDPGTIGAPGAGASLGTYKRCFETDFKIPSCDLPSVGWLGETILWNCAQNGPITLVGQQGQRPDATNSNGPRNTYFANRLENAKLDLFAPWGKPHNLHLYDMFTVQDPMHNGYDDDGDGAIDEDDTGTQSGDLLGPEVRVYGCIDVNHVGVKTVSNLFPGNHVPDMYRMVNTGHPYDRGSNGTAGDWTSTGPLESIGDMLRLDDLRGWPGGDMGAFTSWNCADYSKYKGSYNMTGAGDIWGHGTGWGSTSTYDLDANGIVDERDERDFWFTQSANYMTTRSNVFTAEVVTQVTDPPKHPGGNYLRGAYKIGSTGRVYAEKHLVMLVDRSTTLRFKFVGGVPGPCDFTGPCRVLARRWGHDRK